MLRLVILLKDNRPPSVSRIFHFRLGRLQKHFHHLSKLLCLRWPVFLFFFFLFFNLKVSLLWVSGVCLLSTKNELSCFPVTFWMYYISFPLRIVAILLLLWFSLVVFYLLFSIWSCLWWDGVNSWHKACPVILQCENLFFHWEISHLYLIVIFSVKFTILK